MAIKRYQFQCRPPPVVVDAHDGPVAWTVVGAGVTATVDIDERNLRRLREQVESQGWVFDREIATV